MSSETSAQKRRRLRISLRVMMLLVLVLGLWMGGLVNKARRQREAAAAVGNYGGAVHYDWEFVDGTLAQGTQPHAPRWLRRLFGDEFFQEITSASLTPAVGRHDHRDTADDVLAHLGGQIRLKHIYIHTHLTSDGDLEHLRKLTNLELLRISHAAKISDQGICNRSRPVTQE